MLKILKLILNLSIKNIRVLWKVYFVWVFYSHLLFYLYTTVIRNYQPIWIVYKLNMYCMFLIINRAKEHLKHLVKQYKSAFKNLR